MGVLFYVLEAVQSNTLSDQTHTNTQTQLALFAGIFIPINKNTTGRKNCAVLPSKYKYVFCTNKTPTKALTGNIKTTRVKKQKLVGSCGL